MVEIKNFLNNLAIEESVFIKANQFFRRSEPPRQ